MRLFSAVVVALIVLPTYLVAEDPESTSTPVAASSETPAAEVWSRPEPNAEATKSDPDIFKVDVSDAATPELVQIFSINGRPMATHPPVIDVLPGQQISLRADVLQFGNACSHPEGCPEGRDADQFTWHADDRSDNECSARAPENCRDRTEFESQGNEMIFHIPFAMSHDITIRVSHRDVSATDHIVLHNARLASSSHRRTYPSTPYDYYPAAESSGPMYPTIAPSGINQPYAAVPYDAYWAGWHPYYPAYYPYGPYPAYPVAWWGDGSSGVFVSIGVVYSPWWGPNYWWGPHYYGWAGYRNPGWWRGPYYGPGHPWNAAGARPAYLARPAGGPWSNPGSRLAPSAARPYSGGGGVFRRRGMR